LERPSGFPIAMTGSPTLTCEESANAAGTRSRGGCWTASTARSVEGSVPTIVALYVRPSARTTEIVAPEPAATTWLLVRTRPVASRITPDPWPPLPSAPWTRTETTLGLTAAAVATQFGAVVLPLTSGGLCRPAADVEELAALAGLPKALRAPTVPRLARTAAPAATAAALTQPGRDRSGRTLAAPGGAAFVAGYVGVSMSGVLRGLMAAPSVASLWSEQGEPER